MADGIEDMVSRLRREGQGGFRDYRLHVELNGVAPPIWRRLLVADSIPLPLLHRVLQVAFGWENRHLHQFCVGTVCFGEPDEEFDLPVISERGVHLNQLMQEPGHRVRYEYDFGDGWDHEVVLEEMRASEEAVSVARCLAGERAGPPEDSGGPAAYADLISALTDEAHPQHQDLRRWAGTYDATRFNLDELNHRLARLPKVRRPLPAR
jgi:hypothetical protein